MCSPDQPTKFMIGAAKKLQEYANNSPDQKKTLGKKRGAPFKGDVRDCENERFIKEKRSLFRSFKCFYAKGIYLNPEVNIQRKRYLQKDDLYSMSLINSTIFADVVHSLPSHAAKDLDEHIKVC